MKTRTQAGTEEIDPKKVYQACYNNVMGRCSTTPRSGAFCITVPDCAAKARSICTR